MKGFNFAALSGLIVLIANTQAATSPSPKTFAEMYLPIQFITIGYDKCHKYYPNYVDENAYARWQTRNHVRGMEELRKVYENKMPTLHTNFEKSAKQFREQYDKQKKSSCQQFNKLLVNDKLNPSRTYSTEYRLFNKAFSDVEHRAPNRTLTKSKTSRPSSSSGPHYFFSNAAIRAYLKTGQGPNWNEIDRIVLSWHMNGLVLIYTPHILFKNGDVYKDFELPLTDFSVENSKRLNPNKWGHWKGRGNEIIFSFPGKEPVKKKVYETIQADDNERLEGTWKTTSSLTYNSSELGMTNIIASSKVIQFHNNGRFEFQSSAGSSLSNSGSNIASHTRHGSTGEYHLSHDTMEFKFDDGHTERVGFYFFAKNETQKNPDVFGLAGLTYTRAN